MSLLLRTQPPIPPCDLARGFFGYSDVRTEDDGFPGLSGQVKENWMDGEIMLPGFLLGLGLWDKGRGSFIMGYHFQD